MRLAVASGVLASALWVILAVLLVHPDIYPALHTFGLSAGTGTHYCSAEVVRWHPALSCEASP